MENIKMTMHIDKLKISKMEIHRNIFEQNCLQKISFEIYMKWLHCNQVVKAPLIITLNQN